MNELTQKYRAKNGKAQFEIFAERDGVLYGRVWLDTGISKWIPSAWVNGENTFSGHYNIEEIPATPKWHEYVDYGYKVLCKYWDDDEMNASMGFINHIKNNEEYSFSSVCSWKHAKPIPTQCGKYCTAMKDGKTILLPLE